MSIDVNNNISNNVLPNGTNSDSQNDGYDRIDTPQPINSNTQTHLEVIKGLTSVTDIQNYIGQNVIAPLKSETPPNLSGVDRALVDLIATSANANPQLSAVLYHTIKDNLGYKLNIENQTETGQRKIILNGSGKNITDSHYIQLAKADSDLNAYHNDYFETLGVAPTPQVPITPVSTATVPATQTPTAPTVPTTITETPSTDVSAEQDFDDIEQQTSIIPNFSEKFLNLLPVDADLSDFDDVLIIDTKTGDEVKPKKYNLDDPEEAKEFEDLMARSIIMQTNGKSEAITDDVNMQKIADALAEYITKPYETKISPDGLEEILDNFSLEASSEIFNLVQEQIIQSGNQAHIMKLKNYKNKHSDNGLDGIIGEIYNFNYLGGNSGNPLLFLSDIFANDTTYKLQSTNIDKIARVLGEHTKEYLSSMDSDDPEDIRKNQSSLAFISQTISLLSNSHPENQSQGNIDTLLQAVMAKSGDNVAVKDILTDLAANAGIETFKTVSIQTGQSLMSNFGEFTYTDANGNAKTFSSTEIGGNFLDFKTDITSLLNGTHDSIKQSSDPNNPQGNFDAKALTAAQAADTIAMLSLAQQTAIIAELTDEDIDTLKTISSSLETANPNLTNLIQKLESKVIIDELRVDDSTPDSKAVSFADAIETFNDKNSPQEMTAFITELVNNSNSFLELDEVNYGIFVEKLKLELTGIEGADSAIIIENLTNSLNINGVKFKGTEGTEDTESISASSIRSKDEIFIDAFNAGTLDETAVTTYLDGLTDTQKTDPAFWDTLLANKTFKTLDEYKNFSKSLEIMAETIDSKKSNPNMDIFIKNLTTALTTHTPTFTTGTEPTPLIEQDKFTPVSYLDYIMNDKDMNDNKTATHVELLFPDFAMQKFDLFVIKNAGDIVTTAEEFGKTIDTTTSQEDLALYATALVEYIVETYPDATIQERTAKLTEQMEKIATQLDRGSAVKRHGSSGQMEGFIRTMAFAVKEQSGMFSIEQIGEHILEDRSNNMYAEEQNGIRANRDDAQQHIKNTFINVANGTEAYTMPIISAPTIQTATPATPTPPAPETTTEEQVDDGSLEGGS